LIARPWRHRKLTILHTCGSTKPSLLKLPKEKGNETHLSTEQHQTETDARVLDPYGDAGRTQRIKTAKGQRAKETNGYRAAQAGQDLKRRLVAQGGVSFPKQARLRKRPEFQSLSRWGKKVQTPNFVVIIRPNNRGETRLGITVSGKVGNAVVRNRVKRLLRECFRRFRSQIIPSQDVLVIAKEGAARLSFAEVESELKKSAMNRANC
jgi:ribonuclease P protein component